MYRSLPSDEVEETDEPHAEGEAGRLWVVEDLGDHFLCLFVETRRESVIEHLNLLPGEVLRQPVERKSTGRHFIQYISEQPEARATAQFCVP